nr:uncharacterized protein LOC108065119 [Drosophila takahashii]
MKGFIEWLIAVLACCSVTKIQGQYIDPEHVEQEHSKELEYVESPEAFSFNQKLLSRVQFELDTQLHINTNLRSMVRQRVLFLNNITQRANEAMQNWTNTRNAVMKARQLFSQKKIKVDHSWLLMERCQNARHRVEKVHRIADTIADKKAEGLHPVARRHFLMKYLRLLEHFEDQVEQETRAGMGLSRKRRTRKPEDPV